MSSGIVLLVAASAVTPVSDIAAQNTVHNAITVYTGWAKKTGLFLRVDNFAPVGGRNVRDMSKFSKFYLEKNIKLAYQCVKYSLPNLHKYSMSLKLR